MSSANAPSVITSPCSSNAKLQRTIFDTTASNLAKCLITSRILNSAPLARDANTKLAEYAVNAQISSRLTENVNEINEQVKEWNDTRDGSPSIQMFDPSMKIRSSDINRQSSELIE